MANELVIGRRFGKNGDVTEMTCAEATDITEGTLLELEDLNTCKKVSGAGVAIAGVAVADFKGGVGRSTIGVIKNCELKATVKGGGSAVLGEFVRSGGSDNTIDAMTTLDFETGKGFARSVETGGAGDTVLLRMNL